MLQRVRVQNHTRRNALKMAHTREPQRAALSVPLAKKIRIHNQAAAQKECRLLASRVHEMGLTHRAP